MTLFLHTLDSTIYSIPSSIYTLSFIQKQAVMGWFWADQYPKPQGVGATNNSEKPKSESKCPVNHSRQGSASGCPVAPKGVEKSKCPVDHNQRKGLSGWLSKGKTGETTEELINPLNNMPKLSQQKAPGQKLELPTQRSISTIPKGPSDSEGLWEYPSPQQMFNAMLRKGGGDIPEDAVESMVDVHNFLNEGAWQEILQWEKPYTEASKVNPRLLRFTGRPDDMSPRAQLLQVLGKVYPSKFGTPPPFDRHDWTVLRGDSHGKWHEVRYVIDYYSGPDEGDSPTFILDVRPALDSVNSTVDRLDRVVGRVWRKAMGKGNGSQ